jgi:hypothetical protein
MIKYIGTILFLLSNFIFDRYALEENTGWSIFYFVTLYVALGLAVCDDLFTKGMLTRKIYSIIALFYFARALYELKFIGYSWDDYMKSANSELSAWLFILSLIVLIIGIIINNSKLWVKNLKNIGK